MFDTLETVFGLDMAREVLQGLRNNVRIFGVEFLKLNSFDKDMIQWASGGLLRTDLLSDN